MPQHPPVHRGPFTLAMGIFIGSMTAHATTASPALEGIHVHRSGVSPYFVNAAKQTLKAQEGQCKLMKSVCAMMPAGAGGKDKPACADVAGGFSVKGNLADVGKQETDEYFATTMNLAARHTRKVVLQVKSTCVVEVGEQKSVDIWHFTPKGHTHFELKDSPKEGPYWIRTKHKALPAKAGTLLAGVFPLSATSTVSAALGHKTVAGHKCEVREISGPWSGTFCLKQTNTAFPGRVTLAGKVVAGKDILVEDEATAVSVKVMLPKAHFFPPDSDKIKTAAALSTAPENPTQKWCAKQKLKTGIDPCGAGGADD